MRRPPSMVAQQGFTLVELMAAALVLVVGMLSVASVLQTGMRKTLLNKQRVGATNLARELTESARTAVYGGLTASGAATAIRASNATLASTSGSGAWTVKRATTVYTIAATACAFDDPADKIAAPVTAPEGKCANNPGGTLGDLNGDDFRRLTFDVSWRGPGSEGAKTFRQTTLIANPAGGIGPRIISFPNAADVGPGGTFARFTATTSLAAALHWNADNGVTEGDASQVSGYTSWSIDWPLQPVTATNAVLDGTYTVNAQARDDRGIAGDTKIASVTINRSLPFAPRGFKGGHNTRLGDRVELEWNLNPERDIVGYRVFWAGPDGVVGTSGASDDLRVCPAAGSTADRLPNTATSCQDLSPPAGAARYYVYAIDSSAPDPRGAPAMLDVRAPSPAPAKPPSLSVAGSQAPALTWTASGSGSVAFYRIYRDGTAIAARIGQTAALSYTDDSGSGAAHEYLVSAVDGDYNESALTGPVQWSP